MAPLIKTSFQGGDEKDYPQPVRQSEPTGNWKTDNSTSIYITGDGP